VKPLAEVPAYFITASLHACTHTHKKKNFPEETTWQF